MHYAVDEQQVGAGSGNSNTMSLMFPKRKNEFVFTEPFLKINSANSLQSTFARIVSEKAKQRELVHCLWEPCLRKFSRQLFNS